MEEVEQNPQLRAGELIIIVVVLVMWAGEIIMTSLRFHRMISGLKYMK